MDAVELVDLGFMAGLGHPYVLRYPKRSGQAEQGRKKSYGGLAGSAVEGAAAGEVVGAAVVSGARASLVGAIEEEDEIPPDSLKGVVVVDSAV